MKKKIFIFFVTIMVVILFFSGVRTNIIDELQLVTIVGFDRAEDDQFRGTVTLSAYSMEEELNNVTLSAVSTSTRELRLKLNAMSSRPIHGGKISAIVVQDELAKSGIFSLLDTYYRDPTIALKSYLCVTRGKAETMLNREFPLQTEIGTYLSDMLSHNVDYGNLPLTNMHLFMRAYYEKGKDPIMPILSYTENALRVEGMALFKDDRFVAEVDLNDSFYLKLIQDGYQHGGLIEVAMDQGEGVAVLREIRSNLDLKTDMDQNVIHIDVKVKSRISEYSGGLITEEKVKDIVEAAKAILLSGIRDIVSLMQENQVDPIGLGARQFEKEKISEEEWYNAFQQMDVHVKVDVKIVESGVSQ
ncbi:LOW QUALITY PROTEIN: spore germination protein GerQC [Bacillus sp. JCM 19047]|nr:LOW QUALITY PROTEIN: spore germination protein GerQC [Bacillus sp. JCM 19047]